MLWFPEFRATCSRDTSSSVLRAMQQRKSSFDAQDERDEEAHETSYAGEEEGARKGKAGGRTEPLKCMPLVRIPW